MSRRDQIKMSEAEVAAFLEEQKTMSVATLGKDGRPHVVAMWYAVMDGVPCFWTYEKSQKVVNLRRDPRVTCLIEDGDVYSKLRGVELVADAELIDDYEQVVEFGLVQSERYNGVRPQGPAEEAVRKAAAKRVVVRIVPQRVVSWDHRKLGGAY